MKIIDARIRWMHGWGNHPTLEVLFDKLPDYSLLEYEERDGIYLAREGLIANFYYYTEPGAGYGGRLFTLKMKDGTTKDLYGPWSSNSAAVNEAFGTELAEASITDNPKIWERGYTFTAGTIDLAETNLDILSIVREKQNQHIQMFKRLGFWTYGVAHIWCGKDLPPGWYKPQATVEELGRVQRQLGASQQGGPQFICSYDEDEFSRLDKESSAEQAQIIFR